MSHRIAAVLVLILVVAPALAGPDEEGWERFEAVPAWVTAPPARTGMVSAVDVGLSNQRSLAYDSARVLRERLNLRRQVEARLRPLLGDGAREPALAGARAATVVRKGFHHQRADDPETVGGQVYFAFVLWETPLAAVLASVPKTQHAAAVKALQAQPPLPPWTEVEADPPWVASPPTKDGMFVRAARETAKRADVAKAVADLRAHSHVRSQIQRRLRLYVGGDLAYRAAERAVSHGTVIERAWTRSPSRAWVLWAVPVERILAQVPMASRVAAGTALREPMPPKPWTWQPVDAEPFWVSKPPQWPDHMPWVQAVESEQADVAREHSIRAAEPDIREDLEHRLRPVVGATAADRAARAGARGRVQGAHAIRTRDVGPGAKRTSVVTAWTLWQIPITKVLDVLDPAHHAAARKALTP